MCVSKSLTLIPVHITYSEPQRSPTYFNYPFAHFAHNTPPGYAHVTVNHPDLTLKIFEKYPKADRQAENEKGKGRKMKIYQAVQGFTFSDRENATLSRHQDS